MKNKGFTLVELLGVLVIIVVVSLIVTPIIYTNIENVRLQANKRNTDKLIKTALDYYEKNTMKNEKKDELIIECDGSKCFYENNQSEELTFSGDKPKGHITISKYGEVLQADLLFDRYVCSYIDEKIECKKPDLIIDNITDFNTFLSKVDEYDNKTVVLSSDLDYNNKTFTPTSKTFKGEFNALGYNISNITYTGAYHGIFHTIDGATIKSLKVEKSNFEIDESTDNVGVIVGSATNSNIYNCYSIDNTIEVGSNDVAIYQVGGIVGVMRSGYIYGCNSLRIVIASSNISGDDRHGGIIGYAATDYSINNCNVIDSYISGYENVGGIVGVFNGKMRNSYSKNVIVSGHTKIGGLVATSGLVDTIGYISNISNCHVSYDKSNSEIIEIIGENNQVGSSKIPIDLTGNISSISNSVAGIVGFIPDYSSVTINNVYVKNVIFNKKNYYNGLLIGNVNFYERAESESYKMVSILDLNNVYALSPLSLNEMTDYLGEINDATKLSNTIIFNYNNDIGYISADISTIDNWEKNLDKNWNTTSSKYPILYKIDKNGNPTSYLLGGQE